MRRGCSVIEMYAWFWNLSFYLDVDMQKGAFSIAAKTKVPVVPITLIGTGKIMPAGMEGILNFGSVKVIIHKPIEGSDPQVLCNESRNIIADGLQRHLWDISSHFFVCFVYKAL